MSSIETLSKNSDLSTSRGNEKKTENGGNIWGHLRTNRAYNY